MAALRRLPATYDLARVQDWVTAEEAPAAESLASRLCAECIKTFKSTLREAGSRNDLPQLAYRSLERSGSSLILWAEGHGVADGKLDDVLSKSRTLQRTFLELLVSVSKTLIDRLVPQLISRDDVPQRTSLLESLAWDAKMTIRDSCQSPGSDIEESDSDASSSSEFNDWEEIADDIRTDVECLIDLEPLIKAPFIDPRHSKAVENQPEQPETWTPHQLYMDRISRRFPNAQLELIERLAQANWDRFQRIQSDKVRNIMEREEMQKVNEEEKSQNRPEGTVAAPSEKASNFHDSGLGTSNATGSAYAETVMSYRQNVEHSIRIPSLSVQAKKGDPFECLACGRQVRIMNNSNWKKHLFNDLRPWLCHDASCRYGAGSFTSREDWIQHLALDHGFTSQWQSMNCPLCLEPTGTGKAVILNHLSSHFEEISLSSLPTAVASNGDSDEDSQHHSHVSHSSIAWEDTPFFSALEINLIAYQEELDEIHARLKNDPENTELENLKTELNVKISATNDSIAKLQPEQAPSSSGVTSNGYLSPNKPPPALPLPRKRGWPSRADKARQLRPLPPVWPNPLAPQQEKADLAESESSQAKSLTIQNQPENPTLDTAAQRPDSEGRHSAHHMPTRLEWRRGGGKVYVTGSMDRWSRKYRLHPVDGEPGVFAATIHILPGTHHFKFLVDGMWQTSPDLPTTADLGNNVVNVIEVSADDLPVKAAVVPGPVSEKVEAGSESDFEHALEDDLEAELERELKPAESGDVDESEVSMAFASDRLTRDLQYEEDEAQHQRLRQRRTVGPGSRRQRVLYDDGLYRWE